MLSGRPGLPGPTRKSGYRYLILCAEDYLLHNKHAFSSYPSEYVDGEGREDSCPSTDHLVDSCLKQAIYINVRRVTDHLMCMGASLLSPMTDVRGDKDWEVSILLFSRR